MLWPKRLKRLCSLVGVLVAVFVVFQFWMIGRHASEMYTASTVPGSWQVVIVPGASVLRNGQPSDVLADRLLTALDLYQAKKVEKFLLSGDHGQEGYDEVSVMRDFLLEHGIPDEDLFLDHAGFDTYDTLYRAKVIFGVTSAVISTQKFHLPRALFIADALDFPAIGVIADRQPYVKSALFFAREWPARVKAVLDILAHAQPTYLGAHIDMEGDGQVTWDQK